MNLYELIARNIIYNIYIYHTFPVYHIPRFWAPHRHLAHGAALVPSHGPEAQS